MWPFQRKKEEEPPAEGADKTFWVTVMRAPEAKRRLLNDPTLEPITKDLPPGYADDGLLKVLSLMPVGEQTERGLPAEAILGFFIGEHFVRNKIAVDFMQQAVADAGFMAPELMEAAKHAPDNSALSIIDRRTAARPPSNAPPQDVIGQFIVKTGQLYSYEANPRHQVLTKDGPVHLPSSTLQLLWERYRTLAPTFNTN